MRHLCNFVAFCVHPLRTLFRCLLEFRCALAPIDAAQRLRAGQRQRQTFTCTHTLWRCGMLRWMERKKEENNGSCCSNNHSHSSNGSGGSNNNRNDNSSNNDNRSNVDNSDQMYIAAASTATLGPGELMHEEGPLRRLARPAPNSFWREI